MSVLNFFYFFWISLLMSLLLLYSHHQANKKKFPLDLFFVVTGLLLVFVPLGARLLHVFYEEPQYYAYEPWRIFEFWKGGFVYYGGLLLSCLGIAGYFLAKKRSRSFWETADFFTPSLILGTGLGRFACFVQGCCYGSKWPFAGPFQRYPTQLYILVWEVLLFFVLTIKLQKKWKTPGDLFLLWMALSAVGRFAVEFWRIDFRGALVLGLSISQIIALGLIAVTGLVYLKRPRF
jgi:phosphatidylglycerol---prolipoprotein diacylglyceryl transferase